MSDRSPVSRRAFLSTAGAAATAAALPAGAEAATKKKPAKKRVKKVDVCVVGAGLAGLTSATELKKRGFSVHVIEADVRAGGRVWTGTAKSGAPLNYGAAFIGPGQDRIAALAKSFGVATHPTYNSGQNVLFFNGDRQLYTGTIPPVSATALAEIAVLSERINAMAQTIDPAAPHKSPNAREYDGQTFETFKLANAQTADARKLLDLVIEALFSVQPSDISLLFVLFYIRSAGNLNLLIDTAGGAQERQFTGGSQQIPDKLAANLGKGTVTLGSPVRSMVTKGARTTVVSDRVTVSARRVHVAVPPTFVNRIDFEPGLAALKDQLYQRMPFGSIGKAIGIYPTPFWRAKGLSGQATSDQGPIAATFDISPPSGTPGVLMGFIDGQDARDYGRLSTAERKRRSLEQLAIYFGEEALTPMEFQDVLWDELKLHRGCPVAVPGPGTLTGFGEALHARDGARFFATTETATVWSGYMDGAVQAGQDVADAIAKDLR